MRHILRQYSISVEYLSIFRTLFRLTYAIFSSSMIQPPVPKRIKYYWVNPIVKYANMMQYLHQRCVALHKQIQFFNKKYFNNFNNSTQSVSSWVNIRSEQCAIQSVFNQFKVSISQCTLSLKRYGHSRVSTDFYQFSIFFSWHVFWPGNVWTRLNICY